MPNGKYALITGATSGIGYELTKLFAKDGYNLVIVARSEGRLQEIAHDRQNKYGIEVLTIVKDLFEPNAARDVYDEVKSKGIEINILVNDAGQGVYGFFADTDLQQELNIIQLNIATVVTLTKLFIKDMVSRKEGRILMLASMVSKMPSPLMAVYAATKSFMYSFSESLVNELEDSGVTVTALLPGATATDFFRKAGAENTVTYQDDDLADPTEVATAGYNALMAGDSRIIPGFKNKFQAAMSNFMPDSTLANNMRKQMNDKRDEDNEDDDYEDGNKDKSDKDKDGKKQGNNNNAQGQPIATIQITAQPAGNNQVAAQQVDNGSGSNKNNIDQNNNDNNRQSGDTKKPAGQQADVIEDDTDSNR